MERPVKERHIIAQRAKLWQSLNPDNPIQPGRFRKRTPLGCGNPRCYLCHSEKLTHKPRPQQMRQHEQSAFDLLDMQDQP
jgi:hypothetical protein